MVVFTVGSPTSLRVKGDRELASFIPTAAMAVMQMGVDAAQRGKQAKIAQSAAADLGRFQAEQIRQAQAIESEKRRRALREALATQRARFGAQGVAGGASADAVLSGLAKEAADQERQAGALNRLRIGQIENQNAWFSRRNLLEQSQSTYQSAFNLAKKSLQKVPLLDF